MFKKYGKIIICVSIVIVATVGLVLVNKGIGSKKDDDKSKMDIMSVPSRDKIFVNGAVIPQKTESIFLDASKGSVDSTSVSNGQAVKKDETLFTYVNEAVTEQIKTLNRELENSNNQRQQLVNKKEESKQTLEEKKVEIEKLKEEAKKQSNKEEKLNEKATDVPVMQAQTVQIDDSALLAIESEIKAYDDQIDTIDFQISSLEEQIADLKEKEYSSVVAPIEGKVTLSEDSNSPTEPYITIESNTLIVNGTISEKDHFKITAEQEVKVVVLPNNTEVKGKIISIGNKPLAANPMAGAESTVSQYEVKISLDSQKNLVNGYHVQGTVLAKDYTITIPKSAIVNLEGKNYVFKVVDKKLTKQEVTSKDNDEDTVIIESGLKEEDEILVNPTETTKEGTVVE